MAAVRLFVRGIGKNATEVDLEKLFSKLKGVEVVGSCEIVRDGSTGSSRGFGYVSVTTDCEKTLQRCLKVYNGTKWRGNVLRVEIAKEHYMEKMKREWKLEKHRIERSQQKNTIAEKDVVQSEEEDMPSRLYICKQRHPEAICVEVDLLEPFVDVNVYGDSVERRHLSLENTDLNVSNNASKRKREDDEAFNYQLMSHSTMKRKKPNLSDVVEEKQILVEDKADEDEDESEESEEESSSEDGNSKVVKDKALVHEDEVNVKNESEESEEEESSSEDENNELDSLRPDDGSMFEHIQSMLQNSENGIDAEELARKLKGKVDDSVIHTLLADDE
ncbi:RNA recognition motif domain-containing protein [bacterium]|nr:RNA recognition motif domain-containing protein [bacterium]